MKSFLKYLKGALKMALTAYPVVLVAGGLAGVSGLLADGIIKQQKVYDEVRNTEVVQELIEKEKENLDVPFEESGLSLEEWTSRKEYLESDEFIKDVLKNFPELKEYKDKEHSAFVESLCSMVFALPAAIGFASCLSFYTTILNDLFEPATYKKVIESAKEDFKEAKEIKDSKKTKKEFDEYTEEIL